MNRRATSRATQVVRAAGLVLICVLASSCQSGEEPSAVPAASELGWVGPLDGTNAFVAVVSGDGQIVAYLCDGEADLAEWFEGDVDERGSFLLTSADGATLTGNQSDETIDGSVDLVGGGSHDFSLRPASEGAGLFLVDDPLADRDMVAAGWIVDNDGNQRGSLRIGRVARSAPALPKATLDVNGSRYAIVTFVIPVDVVKSPSPGGPVPIPYPNTNAPK